MRVFVINMPNDADRRASSRAKLVAACVPFEFVEGTSGDAAIEQNLFDAYDEEEFLLNTGRHLTPGEIGCFASHRSLWARAIELDESIMIMEDDFELHGDFPRAVSCAESITDKVGFLRLQKDKNARKKEVGKCEGFTVSRYTKPPHCTMCYCVSPAAAGIFVDHSRKFDAPVDVYLKKYWEHGQPLYALTPYTVLPTVASVVTTIHGRAREKKPLAVALRRFLKKVGWHWQRLRFNARARLARER